MNRKSTALSSLQTPAEPKDLADRGRSNFERLIGWLAERPDASARVVIVAVALGLTWLTWARWGNFQFDFGRELYVPLEILRGRLIYRDLWYPYGPLEPYVAAILIDVFGQHFYVFYLFGLALAVGSALLLFEIGVTLAGTWVGLTAGVGLLFQGFAPRVFNYPLPWSYAGSLGMFLSLLCAWVTVRYVLKGGERKLVFASIYAGLALLCKQEFGVACYVLIAFVLAWEGLEQRSPRAFMRGACACLPGLAPALAIYGWFFWKLTLRFMLQENWVGLPGTYFAHVGGRQLYSIVGLRFVPREIAALVLDGGVALLLWSLLARLCRKLPGSLVIGAGTIAGIAAAVARTLAPSIKEVLTLMLTFPTGMFFIGCTFLINAIYKLSKRACRSSAAEAAFALFALMVAVRILAEVVPYAYGIFYDGPLLLIFIITLTKCVAVAVPELGSEQQRELANSLLAIEMLLLAGSLTPGKSDRTASLRTSWGTMYVEPAEARFAGRILGFMEQQKRNGRRVAIFPELPIMYALTGTEAPSRWYTLLPGFLSPDQEESFIKDLTRDDPDYIILTNRDTGRLLGKSYFGIDYDRSVFRWMRQNYSVAGEFGRDHSGLLTALLYKRRAAAAHQAVPKALNEKPPGRRGSGFSRAA